ncbi:MAG: ATP-binding protein [Candidatus Acidiferrales bacterium]|jgi:signal transduction histidine kinase/CheY-like chemotaxis protein
MGSRISSAYLRSLDASNWGLAKARLRTKFLLSLTLLIAALTFATLAVVRHAAEGQVRAGVEQDARNSVLTFQNLRAERQIQLERTAELLATLPALKEMMADEQVSAMQDASEEIWRSGDSQLFALANWKGEIVALHTSLSGFSRGAAEKALAHSSGTNRGGGWWFGDGHLYQVALRPIQLRGESSQMYLGTVIVGREIDASVAAEVGRIALCQVAFRYGDEAVVSSFSAMDDAMAASALKSAASKDKIEIGNKSYLVSSVNLTPGSSPPLSLTVLKPYNDAMAFLTRLNHTLLTLGFLAVFAGAALVFVLSRTFTQPLESLVQGVRALETGNYDYPLSADSGDEVSEVTGAFKRMRGTLQKNEEQRASLENQLRQAQKMEAVGRLAGGVAHDFNNLLTVIKGHSDLLEMKLGTLSAAQPSIAQVRKAADRATALTRQLLAFSRMQVLQPRVLDLNSLITDLGKMLPMLIGEEIEYTFRAGESLTRVKADPSQIEQVLVNLAVNAHDAMPKGGKLTITTQNVLLDAAYARSHPPTVAGRYVLLTVADTGCGMDEATKARVFEPFFTTKELGKGTGLGLATVYGVVKQSGGYIWVDSAPGQGTRFEIFLPQNQAAPQLPSEDEPAAKYSQGVGTVLLAEDEEAVRELACEFLRSSGYQVITGKDGLDALEKAEQDAGAIDVLVTDVVMPRMRGTELAQRLKRAHPRMKIVYMSGYLEHNSDEGFVADSAHLQKPFSRGLLLKKMREALGQEVEQPLQTI